MASLAGVLYVYYNRFVNPVASSFPISVEAALMAITWRVALLLLEQAPDADDEAGPGGVDGRPDPCSDAEAGQRGPDRHAPLLGEQAIERPEARILQHQGRGADQHQAAMAERPTQHRQIPPLHPEREASILRMISAQQQQ